VARGFFIGSLLSSRLLISSLFPRRLCISSCLGTRSIVGLAFRFGFIMFAFRFGLICSDLSGGGLLGETNLLIVVDFNITIVIVKNLVINNCILIVRFVFVALLVKARWSGDIIVVVGIIVIMVTFIILMTIIIIIIIVVVFILVRVFGRCISCSRPK
jgi:hypothetical protein